MNQQNVKDVSADKLNPRCNEGSGGLPVPSGSDSFNRLKRGVIKQINGFFNQSFVIWLTHTKIRLLLVIQNLIDILQELVQLYTWITYSFFSHNIFILQ